MDNYKLCPRCNEIMFVDVNTSLTNPNICVVKCPKCGCSEYISNEIITSQDLGNYINCLECDKKDRRIAELEKEVSDCVKDMSVMTDINPTIYYQKMNYITTLEKALELACSTHQFEDNCDYCPYNQERLKTNACPCSCEDEPYFNRDCTINYFIQKAEKELEGDKE